ncbi:MAG: hypothetical protein KA956_08220 [Pyrinomonadaceae bacterium]|nr:hypothetical protein [Acidobacteriota bacterium]MBP7376450.1 hypothetical protein [Pyrinomonadaceae bacterium]
MINTNDQRPQLEPHNGMDIFQRIYIGDPTAVEDCTLTYGAYIRELANYNMSTQEEAENAAAAIFDDIRAFARSENGMNTRKPEVELIRQIAVRSIVKQRWNGRKSV